MNIKYILYTDKLLYTDEGTSFYSILSKFDNLINVPDILFEEICGTENSQELMLLYILYK